MPSIRILLTGALAAAAATLAAGEAAGPVSTEEALRIGWPQFAGPFSTFAAVAVSAPLVDDLAAAKVLWTSECRDLGRAKGGSSAYRKPEQFTAENFAKMGSHPGSWAGPIVAEGKVFCASWRPAGAWVDVKGAKVRLDAEDVVVAIDALTGKTAWLAAEPGGILRGGGKRQGFQVAPTCAKGVVYSLGSTARLFAYDAQTGRKRWESEAHPARAAQRQAREQKLAALAAGTWPAYDLNPNWLASLVVAQDVLIVPDQAGGLVGVDTATGAKRWALSGVISRYATPSVWSNGGREHILCANGQGELRLIDPVAGTELWKLDGLGPNWPTLAPGRTHVLVNVTAGSGKTDAGRKPGRLGAVRLSASGAEKAWQAGDGIEHQIPVWMDSGARWRVLYRGGRFLATNSWQGAGMKEVAEEDGGDKAPAAPASAGAPGGACLLIDEASGRTIATLPPAASWNEQLGGLVYWCGDRVLSRADSFHGPKHGGRHPWIAWTLAGDRIARVPGAMDLSEFTNGYEVPMDAPLAGGLMFERTEAGTVVCYDLRAR